MIKKNNSSWSSISSLRSVLWLKPFDKQQNIFARFFTSIRLWKYPSSLVWHRFHLKRWRKTKRFGFIPGNDSRKFQKWKTKRIQTLIHLLEAYLKNAKQVTLLNILSEIESLLEQQNIQHTQMMLMFVDSSDSFSYGKHLLGPYNNVLCMYYKHTM